MRRAVICGRFTAIFAATVPRRQYRPGRSLETGQRRVMLLVDHAIHIIEKLNLEALAGDKVYAFLFAGLPLRMAGATGSPLRPIALA